MQFASYPEPTRKPTSGVKPHTKFTHQEDETLRDLVEELGAVDWTRISQRMEGRNPRQCKERWVNYLAPTLKKAVWTREEDRRLIQKHRELGAKWVQIAKFFPERTDSMVKNRFNRLKRRDQKRMTLFSCSDPMLIRMYQGALFWQMRSKPPMPFPILQSPAPTRIEIPAEESPFEESSIWADDFCGMLDSGFPGPFEFA
jgi:hypothetical protein